MGRKLMVVALSLAAAGAALAQTEGNRVGVFDSQTVWQQTDEGKKFQNQLAAFRDGKIAEINARETDLTKLKDRLREQEVSLSEEKKGQMLKDIDQKSIDLKRLNDDATREMKTQLGESQDQFQRELLQVVEALGREKKYTLILEKSIVVYNDATVEITPEVVAKFNQMFKPSAAPPAKPKDGAPAADPKKPAPGATKKPPGGGQ